MSRQRRVKPVERCPDCKQEAPCVEIDPPPLLHSGWECTNCGFIRWGGVLSKSGPRPIGYRFSGGMLLCWRCHRQHCPTGMHASSYPALDYLSGYMETIYDVDGTKTSFDRCCDECGVLVDADC